MQGARLPWPHDLALLCRRRALQLALLPDCVLNALGGCPVYQGTAVNVWDQIMLLQRQHVDITYKSVRIGHMRNCYAMMLINLRHYERMSIAKVKPHDARMLAQALADVAKHSWRVQSQ